MEYLSEQLALARMHEREMVDAARLHAHAEAIREHKQERRALAWERLAHWASERAQRARS